MVCALIDCFFCSFQGPKGLPGAPGLPGDPGLMGERVSGICTEGVACHAGKDAQQDTQHHPAQEEK